MKKSNILTIMAAFLLIIPICFGVTETVSSFYGQSNPINVTFIEQVNQSYLVNFPNYSYIFNLTFIFNKINTNSIITYSDTFNYSIGNGIIYINYSKPPYYQNSSKWQLKSGRTEPTTVNITLPNQCWIPSNLQFKIISNDTGTTYSNASCFNTTEWVTLSYRTNEGLSAQGTPTCGWNSTLIDKNYTTAAGWVNSLQCWYKSYEDSSVIGAYTISEQGMFWNLSNINIGLYYGDISTYFLNNETASLNITKLNNLLANQQNINLTFYTNYSTILSLNLTNATYSYGIDNCTNSFDIPSNATAYNISFKDTSGNPIAVNYTASISYPGSSFYTATTQLYNYTYCTYPNWFNATANTSIQYIRSSSLYTYNTQDSIFDNVVNYLNFTIESGTTNVLATVYNEIGNELEDAYINVLKYNTATGNYDSIGIFSTNFEGQSQLPLTQDTQLYRFYIYYPFGILKESTNPTYIYSTSITFYIDTGQDFLTDYFTTEGMYSYLTFNNNTNSFRYEFSDTTDEVTSSCMYVYLTQATGTTLYNTSCTTGSSGTLLAAVLNTSGSTYLAKTFVNITVEEIPIDSLSVHFPSNDATETIGLLGILIDVLLTISFSFILFFSVPLGILFIPLPTVMLSSIGFLAIDPLLAWGIQLAALVLAFMMHKRE